jgi:hypothetical protein
MKAAIYNSIGKQYAKTRVPDRGLPVTLSDRDFLHSQVFIEIANALTATFTKSALLNSS